MSFKNKFKDVGNKPKLPPQLQILEDIKENKDKKDLAVSKKINKDKPVKN